MLPAHFASGPRLTAAPQALVVDYGAYSGHGDCETAKRAVIAAIGTLGEAELAAVKARIAGCEQHLKTVLAY